MSWWKQAKLQSAKSMLMANTRSVLIAFAILMAVLVGMLVLAQQKDDSASEQSAVLVSADYQNNQVVFSDKDGKELTRTDFASPASYVREHAVSPTGVVLMSINPGTASEKFFLAGKKDSEINEQAAKTLTEANVIDGQRNVVFEDEEKVVFSTCPADKTCQIKRLNLSSGKIEEVADSGIKSSAFAPVYILNPCEERKNIYVRALGQGKFGDQFSAVYKIELATKKVVSTIKVALDAGYSLKMSPDEKTLAFKTGGFDKDVEAKLVNTADSKETKVSLGKGDVANSANALQWSADSRKLLVMISSSYLRATAAKDNPVKLSLIDMDNSNKVSLLKQFGKTYLSLPSYYNWVDNSRVIYSVNVAEKENDFSSGKTETYLLDIGTKEVKKFDLTGKLQLTYF